MRPGSPWRHGFLALAIAGSATAEPIPAPTGVLRDYVGRGVIQVDVPPPPDVKGESPGVAHGLGLVVEFRQAFVRPDCYLMEMLFSGVRQISQGLGTTERTLTIGSPYVQERAYKNAPAGESPLLVARSSMATYGRVFAELRTGKLLPEEDFPALKAELLKGIADLAEIRKQLKASTDPADISRANRAAADQARLRDDLDHLDVRKAHPCHIVEYRNKDVVQALTSRKMLGGLPPDTLVEGRTRVWITREEGLPLKIDITDNEGRTALFCMLKEVSINMNLKPGDLALGVPPGTQLIAMTADMSRSDWETRMEESFAKEISRREGLRQARNRQEQGLYRGTPMGSSERAAPPRRPADDKKRKK